MRLFLVIVSCLSVHLLKSQDLFGREGGDLFQSDLLNSFNEVAFRWDLSGEKQVYLNEGINFLAEHKPEMALSNLDKLIKTDSSFWVAFYYRGVCLKQMGMYQKAEENLKSAYHLKDDSFEITIELAKVNHLLTLINSLLVFEFEKAEKYYKKAIKIAPDNPVPNFLLGDLAFRNGNKRQALKNYKESLEKDPDFSDAKIKIGLLEVFKDNDVTALIPYLNEVLAKDSLNRTALSLRSMLGAKENPKNSIADFNRLVRISPSNISYRLFRGILYIEVQDYENAFSDLRRVIQATNENENSFVGRQTAQDKKIDILNAGYYTLQKIYGLNDIDAKTVKKAFCLLLVNNFEACIETLNEVRDAKDPSLCFFLKGIAYEHREDHESAMLFYSKTLKFDNDVLDAHKKMGIYLTNLESWDKAEKEFSHVLRLNSNLFTINKLRGVTRYYKNDFKGAILDFSKYLAVDSSDNEALLSRAQSYEKIGEFTKGSEDRLRASDFHVLNYTKIVKSIVTILEVGDTTKALKYVDKFIQRNPTSTGAYVFKLSILIKRKAWDRIPTEVDLALKTVNSAVYDRRDYSFLLVTKGIVYLNDNNIELAKEQFSSAIDIDKTNGKAFLERGRLLLRQQKYKPALKDLKIAYKLGITEANKIIKEIE